MNARTRAKRAILRDRRIDQRRTISAAPPMLYPITGYHLYLINRYADAVLHTPPRTDSPWLLLGGTPR